MAFRVERPAGSPGRKTHAGQETLLKRQNPERLN